MTEYVTNGTFDTDIIGWTDNSTGSATIEWSADNGGSLLLTGAGESVQAIADQQVAATTAGTRYKLTFDVYSISGGFADVDVGTSVGDDSLSENHITSSGSYEDEFTAIGATTWIRIDAEGEGNTVYIDNVSIQEAFSGGYWQSSIGVARLSDPTLQMGDVAYRELIRAKANANNVDPLLANIYTYIVDAHEQITHCTLSDPSTAPLLKDGDMEASGFDDWVQGGSPTLTKETTDPVEGTQYAKIAYNGTIEPYIR